jgi:hypothetical protein
MRKSFFLFMMIIGIVIVIDHIKDSSNKIYLNNYRW